MQDKTQQLLSSQAAKEKLAHHVEQLEKELTSLRLEGRKLQQASSHLPRAEVPQVIQDQLNHLDDLQHRYDALERKLAALEHTASKQETGSHAEGGALGGISQTHGGGPSRAYRASDYVCEATQYDFEALLLEKDVKLFDLALERDQALAQAARFKQRLESLFQGDNFAADARCQSTESDGTMKPAAASGNKTGFGAFLVASGKKRQGAGRKHPTLREQELLDTIELLKNALERTKKGLESGVSNSKYMQAVDKIKQLKSRISSLESQLCDAAKAKAELGKVLQQQGQLHALNTALKGQLRAAKQKQENAAGARENMVNAQVAQLERALQERDAQLQQVKESMQEYGEEIRVLLEEGLHPAALVHELLNLRPRLHALDQQNSELQTELAALDTQFYAELQQLKAEHELLRSQSHAYEDTIRELCCKHGEQLPPALMANSSVG